MSLSGEEQKARERAAQDYVSLRDEWGRYWRIWFAAYYILGTLLLICSATAASAKQLGLNDFWTAFFSWLVVILTAALGFYKPDDRGSRYRQAWSLLQVQISRFFSEPTYTLDHVIEARKQGEAIIYQAPSAPHLPKNS